MSKAKSLTQQAILDLPNVRLIDKRAQAQVKMLKQCVRDERPLAEELVRLGMTYDDLVYANAQPRQFPTAQLPELDEFRSPGCGVPVVSFFSGAGGLDLGFEAAGFEHLFASDVNPLFCKTLMLNRPEWNVKTLDVSEFDAAISILSQLLGTRKCFEGVFIGGPPCQPFSIAANQRFSKSGDNFKRVGFSHEKNGNLLFNFIDLITHYKPKAFLIENVPGLIDVDGGEQLQRAYQLLEQAGYQIHQPLVLKADSFSVPQQRTRLFIVGGRRAGEYKPPTPTGFSSVVGPVFRRKLIDVSNHVTREHSAESVLRYMMLEYGARDQLGRVDRLDPALPSKTVIAGGTKGGGRSHLHPFIPRTLSVRESARIQTFPDEFEFVGPVARQFTQVGNAVPPILAAQLALAIRRSFF